MTGDTLLLHTDDDVAVALRDLEGVPRGHRSPSATSRTARRSVSTA